jgi:hypothetical protein
LEPTHLKETTMRASSIKYIIALGLIGTWVANKQKRRNLAAQAADGGHSLASLVKGELTGANDQPVPTPSNPYPRNNPTTVPTGPAPGG